MTFGSLFSGIGGMDLGLERAGMKCLWQVEHDEFCVEVLRRRFDSRVISKDIREVNFCDLENVQMLSGGFPCQDISDAGQRRGIKGERSGLWSEFARAIREIRPRLVLVENVAAVLVRGFDRVLGDLAASGYDAEWDCLPAAAFGASHLRCRTFLLAYPRGHRAQAGCQFNVFSGGCIPVVCDPWVSASDIRRAPHGIADKAHRLKSLGNAVLPNVAEYIGRRILETEGLVI